MSEGVTPPTTEPPGLPAGSGKLGRIALVVGVLALVGVGAWLLQGGPATQSGATKASTDTATTAWQRTWDTAGFTGPRGRKPTAASAALTAQAGDAGGAAGIAKRLEAWRTGGALREVSLREARRHPVRTAGALADELKTGKAAPVHAVEAAWLARTMCDAAGLSCSFVVATGGTQTPLILSHTRIGVLVEGGPTLVPLGGVLTQPMPLSDELAVAWWLLVRAQAHRGASQYTEAHADIALAAKLAPTSAAPAFARGVVQLDQGLTDRGMDTCEAALAREEDPFARLFLADVVAAMDKPFKAYQHVQRVLQTTPKLAEGHVSLALLDAGRAQTAPEKDKAALLAKATAGFNKALSLEPSVPGARAGLAQLALMAGKTEEAERLLKEAVTQHNDSQAALVLAELLGMTQRSAEAVTLLRKIGRIDDERFVLALVKALAVSGKGPEALKEAGLGAQRFPGSSQLGLLLADLLRQAGKIPAAIAALEPHKTGTDGTRIIAMQAQLLLQNNQAAEAIAALEPLVLSNPTSKELYLLLIVAYGIGGKKDQQATMWRKSIAAGAATWLDVAGVLIETGDATGAETVLRAGLAALSVAEEEGQQLSMMLAMLLTASERKAAAVTMRDTYAEKIADAAARTAFVKAIDGAISGAEAEMARAAAESGGDGAADGAGAGSAADHGETDAVPSK